MHMEKEQGNIIETEYWKVILAYDQTYLGRCIILLKRPCGDLAEITRTELLKFHDIVKRLQKSAKQAFGAEMFNWSCLMNNAYQEKEPKPQVHWHFRPRYKKEVVFLGEKFIDPNFGYHYTSDLLTTDQHTVNQELENAIISEYKKFL